MNEDLGDYASTYGGMGLEVFPCDPTTKSPRVSQYEATTDLDTIRGWWEKWPDSLIGHRVNANTIVLDMDPRHNGHETWKALEKLLGVGQPDRMHFSGRDDGGAHMWYERPEGTLTAKELDRWAKERGVGHDVKGRWTSGIDIIQRDHRYTILPPSPHPVTGKAYFWAPGKSFTATAGPTPAPLVPLITKADSNGSTPDEPRFHIVDEDSIIDWYNDNHRLSGLLKAEGWECVSGTGDDSGSEWRHPAATSAVSATVTDGSLYVWSTSTIFEPTEPGVPRGYDTFEAFATLHHSGDLSEAARAARKLRGPTGTDLNGQHAADGHTEANVVLTSRLVAGDSILDEPETVPSVWGDGSEVLWAEGEAMFIVAPPGVGKTTLMGQLVAAFLAGDGRKVLNWPIPGEGRRVLYLAMDRPRQIARSLRRQLSDLGRERLRERLLIWKGPPPKDLAQNPELLLQMCYEARLDQGDVVILDSLKDTAVGITDDATGAGLNQAHQHVLAAGFELGGLHHQRKGQNGAKPKTLEDVYGSTWITAGAGSVLLLWGAAGDLAVEMIHLKQPVEVVGPLKLIHDHEHGTTSVEAGFDPLQWLKNRPNGGSARDAATALKGGKPSRNEIEIARRSLEGLVKRGHVERFGGAAGGSSGGEQTIYRTAPLPFTEAFTQTDDL